MRRTAILSPLAVVALLVTPAGAATWMAYGAYEPDSALDQPTLMWFDPPGATKNKIYFNAYRTWGDQGANGGTLNPNVGALRTTFGLPGEQTWEAVFGVWTDCNGDGYVGMVETAVREYAAAALLDHSLCPPTSGPPNTWNGENNYNGWVTELIPIGNAEATKADKRVWKDDAAMVWGDPGKPDDAWPDPGVVCRDRARGEAQTTGGFLYWIDCQGNRGIVDAFNEADATLGLGLGMGDHPPSSSSPLNQPTFGPDGSEHSAVYLQDCDQEPLLVTPDLPGGDLDHKPILRPVPPNPVNPNVQQWSVPGTINYTLESVWLPPAEDNEGPTRTGNCDFSDDSGQDFYRLLEEDVDVPPTNGKDAAQWNMFFVTASRGTLPANFVSAGGAGAPTDLGVEALGTGCGPSSCWQSHWRASSGFPEQHYVPPVTRGTLEDGSLDGDETTLADAPYWSFYAYVGTTTFSRGFVAPGGTGVYGSVQCGGTGTTSMGWNCDPDQWYLETDGSPVQTDRPLARVGQVYQFRDIDCVDGRIGDTGIGIDPAFYGPTPCA